MRKITTGSPIPTNTNTSDKPEAINKLREWIRPGDTLYTLLRHVSRSGMQRSISVLMLCDGNTAPEDVPRVQAAPTEISMWVARALGDRIDQQRGGIKVSGSGMDMGFEIVYNLGRMLWPSGFGCIGEKCRSNDHSNGDRDYTPHDESAHFESDQIAASLGAPRRHWHTDGGYALQRRWL